MSNSLENQLLKAALLCNMKPNKSAIYRLQLFFVANKNLKSKSHQSDFQKVLQTGVKKGYWSNYGGKWSGEYVLTLKGYKIAKTLFSDIIPLYLSIRGSDYRIEIIGNINGMKIKLKTCGCGKSSTTVFIDESQCRSAKEACRIIENNSYLQLPTFRDSAVRVLYNMAIDNEFQLIWKGPTL